jgi:hypothetical protein
VKKHGIHQRETGGETVYDFYWLGELVNEVDFNERLAGMTRSAAKDLDWMAIGMDLKENLNEGEKTVAQLDEVEKIAKLPLCPACRKLIGEIST